MCELSHRLLIFLGMEMLFDMKLDLVWQMTLSRDLLLDLKTRVQQREDPWPVCIETQDQIACPFAYFH